MPWAYPLSAHGLGSVRPNIMKVRHAWVDEPIGWRFNILWGWRFKVLGVDSSPRGWHELRSFVDRLSSIYEVWHVSLFDWILSRIEASLRLPCISHIYICITILLPHFSTFQLKHIVKAPSSTLLESVPSNICTRHLYNRRPSVTQTWWVLLLFFTSLAFALSFC